MPILIYTEDETLAEALSDPPPGATTEVRTLKTFAVGSQDVIMVAISLTKDVAVGLFSAWLYDRLKNKRGSIEYRRKKIECEEHIIRRTVDEEISVVVQSEGDKKT